MTKFLVFFSNSSEMIALDIFAYIVNSGYSYAGGNVNHLSWEQVTDKLKEKDTVVLVIFSSFPENFLLIELVQYAIRYEVPIIAMSHKVPASGLESLLESVGYMDRLIPYYPDASKKELEIAITKTILAKMLVSSPLIEVDNSVAPGARPDRIEEVHFTAYHPKEAQVNSWHTLLVYTHVFIALGKVQQDAQRFRDQITIPKESTARSSTRIPRGTEITIIPSCEGVTFNPQRVSFNWLEDFHRVDFRFKADQSLSGDAAKGSIDIYAGPLIIGALKFAMLFNEKEDAQPILTQEEHSKMYGKNDVFISYSRKDTDVARTFKIILESSGLDVFLDVDNIRSGQLWEEELKRRIEQAKIFQIFWSPNYSQSENCKKEWKYALKQNRDEGYIRPVYWKTPLSPKPPKELNKYNFKYVELKIANGE